LIMATIAANNTLRPWCLAALASVPFGVIPLALLVSARFAVVEMDGLLLLLLAPFAAAFGLEYGLEGYRACEEEGARGMTAAAIGIVTSAATLIIIGYHLLVFLLFNIVTSAW